MLSALLSWHPPEPLSPHPGGLGGEAPRVLFFSPSPAGRGSGGGVISSLDTLITDDMRACIGKKSPVWSLPEEISASDVRRFAEATGDQNPLWMDDDFARSVGYRGRRVPPQLVQQMRWRIDSRDPGESDSWSGLKFPPGYTSTRNAGQEVEWLAAVCIGDRAHRHLCQRGPERPDHLHQAPNRGPQPGWAAGDAHDLDVGQAARRALRRTLG